MIVVADTSPINYLVQIGLVDVLLPLYSEIILPAAVLKDAEEAHLADFEGGVVALRKLGFRMTDELIEEIRRR